MPVPTVDVMINILRVNHIITRSWQPAVFNDFDNYVGM